MTRIGFAYNQKPEPEAADAAAELSRADEEPPSSGTRNDSATATLLARPRRPTTSTPSGTPPRRSTPSPARSRATAT